MIKNKNIFKSMTPKIKKKDITFNLADLIIVKEKEMEELKLQKKK